MKARSSKSLHYGFLKKMWPGGDWTGTDQGYSGMMSDSASGTPVDQNVNSYSGNPEMTGSGGATESQGQSGWSTDVGNSIVGAGINLGSSYISNFAGKRKNPNSTYTPDGQFRTQKGAQGIQQGWNVGNKIYPGIGGIIGAFAGGIYGVAKGNKMDKEAKQQRGYEDTMYQNARNADMQNRAANQDTSPNFEGYYKHGGSMSLANGFLTQQKATGGSINATSNNTSVVSGNSHDDGGVKVPVLGLELENKETVAGNYVFSKELGFAKLHKPIATAKGKIEAKAATPERLNALKLLNNREETLKLHQEYMKKALNIN